MRTFVRLSATFDVPQLCNLGALDCTFQELEVLCINQASHQKQVLMGPGVQQWILHCSVDNCGNSDSSAVSSVPGILRPNAVIVPSLQGFHAPFSSGNHIACFSWLPHVPALLCLSHMTQVCRQVSKDASSCPTSPAHSLVPPPMSIAKQFLRMMKCCFWPLLPTSSFVQ